jgi:tetratricopeptide (TPR) repeat protein
MRFAAALTFACLLAGSGARAQEPDTTRAEQQLDDERAHAHYLAGESHFAAERWGDAAREFTLAYELSRRPEMLINLSRAHERGGQLQEALADLEALLSSYPETNYRLEAEQRIGVMRAKLEAPPVEAAVAPPLPPVQLPQETKPVAHAASFMPQWPTLVVGSVALAAGITSLATGLRGHGIYGDLNDRCPHDLCSGAYRDDRDKGRALARASTGLMFSSIALAGATAVMWVLDVKRDQRTRVGTNVSAAQLRLSF